MSETFGAMSLEDPIDTPDTPPPAPEAPAQAPQAPQQAAPPADEPEPEGVIVNPGGEKLVPLGALAGTRQQLRQEKEARERLEAEIAQVREKASKYDQVAQEWRTVEPLIQQLKAQQFQPPPPQRPAIDPRAEKYARDFDLYKTDGTPDVERAQRIMEFHAAQAQEQAKALVAPLYQQTAQQQSHLLREKVAAQPAPNGVTVDRGILDQIWSMVPPEMSARPEVAAMLWRQALADTVLQGKYRAPVSSPPPVVQTESLGGSAPVRELTSIDRNMMSAGGIRAKDYEQTSAQFKPGQANSLE